jgi:hypothetical protein
MRYAVDSLEAIPVSRITPKTLSWLWLKRLALGTVAILEGDPNLGKSLIALDLCARITTGRPLPDGTPSPGPANVLIVSCEDRNAHTLRPRLEAAGADLERVFIVSRKASVAWSLMRLPSEVAALERLIQQTGAKLVVIEPIMAFLDPSVQVASDANVRQALQPLIELAERYDCCILLIRHLSKAASQAAMYRGGGSIGFVGVCRSAWLAVRAPKNPQQCLLAEVKNNLAAPQTTLRYELLAPADEVARVHWLGRCSLKADQLLGLSAKWRMGTAVQRAHDFLQLFLHDGPRTCGDVWEASRECCFGKTALRIAKRELKIRSKRCYVDKRPVTYWLFPHQVLPTRVVPEKPDDDSLEPWLQQLREAYPDGTPIDDL